MIITIDPPRHSMLVEFEAEPGDVRRGTNGMTDLSPGVRITGRVSGPNCTLSAIYFFSQFCLPLGWVAREKDFFRFDSLYLLSVSRRNLFRLQLVGPYERNEFRHYRVSEGLQLLIKGRYPSDMGWLDPPSERPVLGGFTVDTDRLVLKVNSDGSEVHVAADLLKPG